MEPKARYRIKFMPNSPTQDDNSQYHVMKVVLLRGGEGHDFQYIESHESYMKALLTVQEHFIQETDAHYSDVFIDTVHNGNDTWIDVYNENDGKVV